MIKISKLLFVVTFLSVNVAAVAKDNGIADEKFSSEYCQILKLYKEIISFPYFSIEKSGKY
jgi:hypothetical protein